MFQGEKKFIKLSLNWPDAKSIGRQMKTQFINVFLLKNLNQRNNHLMILK